MLTSLGSPKRQVTTAVVVTALAAVAAVVGTLDTSHASDAPEPRAVAGPELAAAAGPESTAAATRRARQLEQARRATLRFRDVEVARAAGYEQTSPCVADPEEGGMGIHYLKRTIEDGTVDRRRPEILLYEPRADGTLRLVGIEYYVPEPEADGRPRLFRGKRFDGPMPGHWPGQPAHYDLHVWVHRRNPSGMFKQYNPRVNCNPAPAS